MQKPTQKKTSGRFSIVQQYVRGRWFNPRTMARYQGYLLTGNPDHLFQAKKLHARVYLRRNFIAMKDVTAEGVMTDTSDPHQYVSTYFVICDQTQDPQPVVVSARQIHTLASNRHDELPIMNEADIYQSKKDEIQRYAAADCVEISGLVKHTGHPTLPVLMVYRLMWQYSVQSRHKIWLMACDPALYARLKYFFGDAIERIGNDTPYVGADVVPAMLKIDEAIIRLKQQSKTLMPIRRGMNKTILEFFQDPEDILVLK